MKFVPNALSSKLARVALHSQKASPQLLFAAGVIGMGATVVLSCRATLKVEAVLDEHDKKMEKIERGKDIVSAEKYSDSDIRRDRTMVYVQTTVELGKLYGPAIICGVLTVSALVGSHNILSKRNAALTAAYGTLQKAMDGYRDRVAAEVGREREQEIYHDVRPCEIEDEKGKKTVRKMANGGSPYAKLFDEHNVNWEPTPEYNTVFLKLQQQFANNQLQARGHVFLNEVYDALGLDRTPAGAVVGWVKDEGDNFIDFGIFREDNQAQVLDFMVGREKAIWLDFNVDGVIYDRI